MDLGLKNKITFITGGSGIIGSALARVFAAEGARVALTYHANEVRAKELAEEIGGTAVHYDLGDPASINAAVEGVVTAWGRLDVLVANAALMRRPVPGRAFEDIPVEEWTQALRVNLEGTFHTVQAALPVMKAGGWGRIVFLSSDGIRVGMVGREEFAAGKAALEGFSRSLAAEVGRSGVLSNVVAPGGTMPEEQAELLAANPMAAKMLDRTATGRFSSPSDVANAVAFLASAANGNITGAVVPVSGGM
ncbi:SDR family NAD(P)-dependent oxidoreductase [Nonomuraea polychroma]|uniref:SDR family NAD(P)-dependent oxidoreductase n=1 Tax=Nonomuraea polychroma TaxID=46176 RepID=UPI003D8B7131